MDRVTADPIVSVMTKKDGRDRGTKVITKQNEPMTFCTWKPELREIALPQWKYDVRAGMLDEWPWQVPSSF